MATPARDLEELAERADRHLREATAPALLSTARGLLNETKVAERRDALERAYKAVVGSVDAVHNVQLAELKAREAHDEAKDAHAAAVLEAEWLVGENVIRTGNKTMVPTGRMSAEGDVPVLRQVTADEARAWVAEQVKRSPDVKRAAERVRATEHGLALCRIDVGTAESRAKAARVEAMVAEQQAQIAVASLNALARTLGGRE